MAKATQAPPVGWSYSNDLWRAHSNCRFAFSTAEPRGRELVQGLIQEQASLVLSIERACEITNQIQHLMASFVRTSAITAELILRSDLIEAVGLLRKQMELIARLRELDGKSPSELRGKVPNVSVLPGRLKELYGAMSSSVHSSDYGSLSLLGYYEGRDRIDHPLYPEFTENTLIIFSNWCQLSFNFTLWIFDFKKKHVPEYVQSEDEARLRPLFDLYVLIKSKSPYIDRKATPKGSK